MKGYIAVGSILIAVLVIIFTGFYYDSDLKYKCRIKAIESKYTAIEIQSICNNYAR